MTPDSLEALRQGRGRRPGPTVLHARSTESWPPDSWGFQDALVPMPGCLPGVPLRTLGTCPLAAQWPLCEGPQLTLGFQLYQEEGGVRVLHICGHG